MTKTHSGFIITLRVTVPAGSQNFWNGAVPGYSLVSSEALQTSDYGLLHLKHKLKPFDHRSPYIRNQ